MKKIYSISPNYFYLAVIINILLFFIFPKLSIFPVPYNFTGIIFLVIGLVVLLTNIAGLIIPVIFFLVMDRMFIPFEEEKMERELGQTYLDYKKNVRCWL